MEYAHLEEVKTMIGVTGDYQNKTISGYAKEVVAYMVVAGVKGDIASGPGAVGVVARGVSVLWNYGSGEGKLSQYFKERVIQLAYKTEEKEDGGVQAEDTV